MAQEVLNQEFKILNHENPIRLVESIRNYIEKNDCPHLSMDISNLNLIDASKVTVLCSTYHWAKYPEGKISWKTTSDELQDIVNPLNLGNISLINAR